MTNQMCQNLSWFRNQNVSNHLTTDRGKDYRAKIGKMRLIPVCINQNS